LPVFPNLIVQVVQIVQVFNVQKGSVTSLGFRSQHGCGAAGVSHPSSLNPTTKIIENLFWRCQTFEYSWYAEKRPQALHC